MTPHKHAALIHAWAEGAQIQYDFGRGWSDYAEGSGLAPSWNDPLIKFRVKPKAIRYRNFLWLPSSAPDRQVVCVCSEKDQQREPRESWCGFIKWLGDWQEVEV